MTLSQEARRKNLHEAILLLMENLHGQSFMEEFIDERHLDRRISPTTWKELRDQHFVRETNSRYTYTLSGPGWIAGLKLRGEFDSNELKELTGKLCGALKDRVKGRSSEELVSVAELSAATGIPEAFIRNAVESDLIGELFSIKGAAWESYEDRGKFIHIPEDFGMRLLC